MRGFDMDKKNTKMSLHTYFFFISAPLLLALISIVSSNMEAEKRAPFNAWAGKRSPPPRSGDLIQILRDLNDYLLLSGQESQGYFLDEGSNEEKRGGTGTPFNAWGGKRKVTPFNAWAGKRSIYLDGDDEEAFKANRYKRASEDMTRDPNERKYAKMSIPFSAWGGKRGLLRFARNVNVPSLKVMRPARAVFSAWGGK